MAFPDQTTDQKALTAATNWAYSLICILWKDRSVVPEFVELGIDAWQGMEINDIPKLKSITGMNLGYHTTPDYQGYQTEALAGTLTEEDLRRRVREVFEKTAEGYCYCPMFLPFGGWSTEVMIDEIMKCGKTIYKDA